MTVGAPWTLQPSPSILFCFQLLLRRRKTLTLSIQRCCSPNASFVGPFFSLTHCLNSANVETRFCDNECNVLLKKTMADILTVINTAAKLVAAVLNGIFWKQAVIILFLTLSSPDLLVLKFSSFLRRRKSFDSSGNACTLRHISRIAVDWFTGTQFFVKLNP